jgi:hypothetical protein
VLNKASKFKKGKKEIEAPEVREVGGKGFE